MLKFESLELLGFKSFANKTRIQFDDHITVVVGPNGCGKSNLSDAMGWSLGLQSAHGLRGQKMEDVIFNGTKDRKQSGIARVTLAVSRSEDDRPLVVAGQEISDPRLEITRRIYRNGDGSYLINGRRCRLKDIRRFIDESGLGFAPYALIAQGKIDSFLNAKPLDRRAIIEEAAQISTYRSQRRSAQVKLELARQNLVRVNDIVSEVERQLRSLKRQAGKAQRYRDLKRDFEGLLKARFAVESREYERRRLELCRRLDELSQAIEEAAVELALREKQHRESLQIRESLESNLSRIRQDHSQVQLKLDRGRNARRYDQEQIENTRRQLESNAAEQKSIRESLESTNQEQERLARQRRELVEKERLAAAVLEERRLEVADLAEQAGQAERELEQLRRGFVDLSTRSASLRNQKEQLESRVEEGAAAQSRLQEERDLQSAKLEELNEDRGLARESLSEARLRLERRRQALDEQLVRRQDLRQEIEHSQVELQEAQSKQIAARERLQSLEEIEISRSQYSQGVQQLLNRLASSQSLKSDGTLADHVETSPEFERLVEEFLDQELEFVMVDSLEDAAKGVSEVRSLNSGKCTFLSLSSNGYSSDAKGLRTNGVDGQDGVFGRLGDLLQMRPEVKQAFLRVLPQRAGAVVVSDLDRAFQLAHSHPQSTFLTLQGEALQPSGLLSSSASQSKKLGLLGLKRQKKSWEKKLLESRRSVAALEKGLEQRRNQLESLEESCRRGRAELHQAEKELVGLGHRLEQAESDVERHSQSLAQVEDRLSRQQSQQAQMRESLQSISQELEQTGRSLSRSQQLLDERRLGLDRLKSEAESAQSRYHGLKSESEVGRERLASVDDALRRLEQQRLGLEERRQSCSRLEEQGRQQLERAEQALEQLKRNIEALHKRGLELDQELAEAESEHQRWKQQHPSIEKELESLRERRMQIQEERASLEVERARAETQLQGLGEQCRELLQVELDQAVAGIDADSLERRSVVAACQDSKERLERFGPVNMTALQEYQESEERYEFLNSQRSDIEKSIEDTLQAIEDLNHRSRERFQEAFDCINGHFQALFRKLFGGGDCGMRLLDEEDVLESGLDVYAQPTGKKLQHVSLLSGGEKALTGLALLMALFQYRPSRFCILDEVDAPLDDANVLRFAALVRDMSLKTQFIVITHNKRTMEIANAIYGVTMEEPGVSQVVSAKF